MNKLYILKNMGFKITWKLINLGLFGDNTMPPLLSRSEIVEYLESLLIDVNEQTDCIISLVCATDSNSKFDRILMELSNNEDSDTDLQKRKLIAYQLKNLLDNISEDSLQGLLELMEFWISYDEVNNCPQEFPNSEDVESVEQYFTQKSYQFYVNRNRVWLDNEIVDIINLEDGS